MGKALDLKGITIGLLTGVAPTDKRRGSKVIWEFVCACGNTHFAVASDVVSDNNGRCKSCTKERNIAFGKSNKTHGFGVEDKVYRAWLSMKSRCYNLNRKNCGSYKDKGIRVCEEWLEDFLSFKESVGDPPSDRHSIDRICSYGDYEPNNVRWVSPEIQARNTSLRKNNKTGVTGVVLDKHLYPKYRAMWMDLNGRQRSKSFSVESYGEQEAFRLACEYREAQIQVLNEQGAGYSEGHGK